MKLRIKDALYKAYLVLIKTVFTIYFGTTNSTEGAAPVTLVRMLPINLKAHDVKRPDCCLSNLLKDYFFFVGATIICI